jgi:hypothetical protein
MESSLTKIDVARRQLVTAIRLLFDGGDPVSIYSIAANAWEVIDVLCNKAGVESMSNQTRQHIQEGADLKFDYVNSPYRNFFKHAERDPDATLPSFDESNIDSVIFLGVEDYLRLVKKSPVEFQVFQLWYLATNVEKVSTDSLSEILLTIDSAFPSIRNLARKDQILMGRRVLKDALKDDDLVRDNRTEGAF